MKKNNLKEIILSSAATLAFPMLAMAQATTGGSITSFIGQLTTWVKNIIAFLFVLVTLYFIWGVVQYVKAGGDDTEVKKGKQHMIYGIIGMIAMISVWGIVTVVTSSLGTQNTIPNPYGN